MNRYATLKRTHSRDECSNNSKKIFGILELYYFCLTKSSEVKRHRGTVLDSVLGFELHVVLLYN